jgi:pilus assembly protein CpaB
LNRKFLVVAVLLAALSATLIYAGLSSRGGGSTSSSGGASVSVVVAKSAIKQRTTITRDMLDVKTLGQDAILAGSFSNADDVVGKVTKFPIEANQQVISTSVVDTTKPVTDSLAVVVPNGRRAVSIKATQVLTAGGLLLPGDYVDVVWECCSGGVQGQGTTPGSTFTTTAVIFARPIVQNVQVAAVAQDIVSSGPVGGAAGGNPTDTSGNPVAADAAKKTPDAITITLLVTPEQANILLLGENTGEMRASLRNPGDTATVPFPQETQYLVPGLIPPEVLRFLQDNLAATKP